MSWVRKRGPWFLPIFLWLALVVFIFLTYRDYGISWDENSYQELGAFLTRNFGNARAVVESVPNFHLATHGSLSDVLYFGATAVVGKSGDYEFLHLVKALLASVLVILVYKIAGQSLAGSWAGVAAGLFLLFFPRWLGDIFDNKNDVWASLLYGFLIYLAIKVWVTRKGRSLWGWTMALAVVGTLAFSHRAILMLFLLVFTPFFLIRANKLLRRSELVALLTCGLVIFLGVTYLSDPYIRYYGLRGIITRIGLPAAYYVHIPSQVLFEGKEIATGNLPWYYLLKWLVVTIPLGTLSFLLLGLGGYWRDKIIKLLLIWSLIGPIIATIIWRPAIFDGWRHFLFLVVPIVVIAAAGLGLALRARPKILRFLAVVIFGLEIILTGREIIRLHPYEYVYFNGLIGGLPGAFGRYETDYWAKSSKEAVIWLLGHEILNRQKTYYVYGCGDPSQFTYYFPHNVVLTKLLRRADYFICVTRDKEDKLVDDQKTVYVVSREGVPLNYVKLVK